MYKLIRLFGDIRFLVDEGESPRQEDHSDGFKRIKSEESSYNKYVDYKYAYRYTSGFQISLLDLELLKEKGWPHIYGSYFHVTKVLFSRYCIITLKSHNIHILSVVVISYIIYLFSV